jgi:nucleotide-binding universal stress UspA family protein
LRGAEVHAVHVREENCHSLASYAVPALSTEDAEDDVAIDVNDLVRTVQAGQAPGVQVRVEEIEGLAARVLLDRCEGADMLILGTPGDVPGGLRSAGPVIRACLRRAPCAVVVISAAMDPTQERESAARTTESAVAARVKVPAGV